LPFCTAETKSRPPYVVVVSVQAAMAGSGTTRNECTKYTLSSARRVSSTHDACSPLNLSPFQPMCGTFRSGAASESRKWRTMPGMMPRPWGGGEQR